MKIFIKLFKLFKNPFNNTLILVYNNKKIIVSFEDILSTENFLYTKNFRVV